MVGAILLLRCKVIARLLDRIPGPQSCQRNAYGNSVQQSMSRLEMARKFLHDMRTGWPRRRNFCLACSGLSLAPGWGRRGHPISGYHVFRPGARRLRCREKPDAARNDLLGHASSPTGCLCAFSLFTRATLPWYASTAHARYSRLGIPASAPRMATTRVSTSIPI
jgi:hypothetical protein